MISQRWDGALVASTLKYTAYSIIQLLIHLFLFPSRSSLDRWKKNIAYPVYAEFRPGGQHQLRHPVGSNRVSWATFYLVCVGSLISGWSPNTKFNIIFYKKKRCTCAVTGSEPNNSPGWQYKGTVWVTLWDTSTCFDVFNTQPFWWIPPVTGATVIPPLDNHSSVH